MKQDRYFKFLVVLVLLGLLAALAPRRADLPPTVAAVSALQ
jgi:hypothetical protein